MKILVTGGTGFTGTALVFRLLHEGHVVTCLDHKEGLMTDELRKRGADVVIGSVTDQAVVRSCVQDVDTVFHVAAAFRELNVNQNFYDDVNIGGTRIVCEAAHAAGVRKLIYCSTCGVHGNIASWPAGESAPIQPADYYQRTKYEGELVVNEFFGRGLKTVIIRPAGIFGPGDPERYLMIYRRVAKGLFPMFGNGKALYHSLYIDNLVDAFMLAMEGDKGNGQSYLIADDEYVEIEDLVRRVARAMGVDVKIPHYPLLPLIAVGHLCEKVCRPFHINPPIFPRRVDWFRQNRAFKIDKAKKELGYHPQVSLDEGLRRTFDWYKSAGYL